MREYFQHTLQRVPVRGFLLAAVLWVTSALPSLAAMPWQVAGQTAIAFHDDDPQARDRIVQLERRLAEIAARLDPSKPWKIDVFPDKLPDKATAPPVATIRVQGQSLLEVSAADAARYGGGTPIAQAKQWAASLATVLGQVRVRQHLVAFVEMPATLTFGGATYRLRPEVALDRGLFRTDGTRVQGRIVFWEIPANSKTYAIGTTGDPGANPKQPPARLYLLNRQLQFVPYAKQEM